MTGAPKNRFKAALRAPGTQRGIWLNIGGPVAAEIAASAGFDWALIDGEHGPWDPVGIQDQLRALDGAGVPAIVRLPVAEAWVVKQALDLGAGSVMVPMIETAEAARAMVAACRYPPEGIRGLGSSVARSGGYGARPDYPRTANAETALVVQVESRAALQNLDEICAVEGVDCVFIGPADLGADLGYRDDLANPALWVEIKQAIATIQAAGKHAGIIVFDAPTIAEMTDLGVAMLGVGSDATILQSALTTLAAGR